MISLADIGALRPEDVQADRLLDRQRQRARMARESRAALVLARRSAGGPRISDTSLATVVHTLPGARHMLGMKRCPTSTPCVALVRLVLSAKIRGSGSAIERARTLQRRGAAMLGSSALVLQQEGLARWLRQPRGPSESHRIRAASLMWDEASQMMKGLVAADRATSSQLATEVMVTLAQVCSLSCMVARHADGTISEVHRRFERQPWLTVPRFVESTAAKFWLTGLLLSSPVPLDDTSKTLEWCADVDLCIVFFCPRLRECKPLRRLGLALVCREARSVWQSGCAL